MKVLLTGGAGYIGSHTCIELINAGFETVIADDFSNSKPEVVSRIKEITGVDVPVYDIDVADRDAVDKMFRENEIGAVVHFAGFKGISADSPEILPQQSGHDAYPAGSNGKVRYQPLCIQFLGDGLRCSRARAACGGHAHRLYQPLRLDKIYD